MACAGIAILAIHRKALTATIGARISHRACVAVIAGFCVGSGDTSRIRIARIGCAWIAIVAGDGLACDTHAIQTGIARCACVLVTARHPIIQRRNFAETRARVAFKRCIGSRRRTWTHGCKGRIILTRPWLAVDARCVAEQRPIAQVVICWAIRITRALTDLSPSLANTLRATIIFRAVAAIVTGIGIRRIGAADVRGTRVVRAWVVVFA